MDREELLRKLDALARMETDAMELYAEAVNCSRQRNPEMTPHMERNLGDHKRHAEAIAATIIRLGGTAPEEHFDAVGRHLHWPTMLHANPCKEGELDALQAAEHYHSKCYDDALMWDVPEAEIATMIREFAADERRHKAFIREQITVAV